MKYLLIIFLVLLKSTTSFALQETYKYTNSEYSEMIKNKSDQGIQWDLSLFKIDYFHYCIGGKLAVPSIYFLESIPFFLPYNISNEEGFYKADDLIRSNLGLLSFVADGYRMLYEVFSNPTITFSNVDTSTIRNKAYEKADFTKYHTNRRCLEASRRIEIVQKEMLKRKSNKEPEQANVANLDRSNQKDSVSFSTSTDSSPKSYKH